MTGASRGLRDYLEGTSDLFAVYAGLLAVRPLYDPTQSCLVIYHAVSLRESSLYEKEIIIIPGTEAGRALAIIRLAMTMTKEKEKCILLAVQESGMHRLEKV